MYIIYEMSEKILFFDVSSIAYTHLFQKDVLDEVLAASQFSNNTFSGYEIIKYYIFRTIFDVFEYFSPISKVFMCFDSPNSWRKDIYTEYKKNRKQFRDLNSIQNGGQIDWISFFQMMDSLYQDFKDYFPFISLKVERVEADDLIYVAIKKHIDNKYEKIIITRDSDYIQLLKYNNVKIFDYQKKQFKTHKNPDFYLLCKILTGDRSDNIPPIKNRFGIKSVEKFILNGNFQKLLEEEKINYNIFKTYKTDEMKNYERNKKLIDFSEIPQNITNEIENTIEKEEKLLIDDNNKNVFQYFISKKYRIFIENSYKICNLLKPLHCINNK